MVAHVPEQTMTGPMVAFSLMLGVMALILSAAALIMAASSEAGTVPTVAPVVAVAADPIRSTVDVRLDEFSIDGELEVPTGEVTLHVTNEGLVPHNLALRNGPSTPDLEAGESHDLELGGLARGTYELICTIPGHEEAGMHAPLLVVTTATPDHTDNVDPGHSDPTLGDTTTTSAGHDEAADHNDDEDADHGPAADLGDSTHGDLIPAVLDEPSREIDVGLSEFAFGPDTVSVVSGETVRFNLTNTGVVEHEFRLSNQPRIDEHIAAGHASSGADHGTTPDIVVLVQPGETRSVDVTFPDTTSYTVIACLIPGHYEAGMSGSVDY